MRVRICQNLITFISLGVIPYVQIQSVLYAVIQGFAVRHFSIAPGAIYPANQKGNGRHQHMLNDVTE